MDPYNTRRAYESETETGYNIRQIRDISQSKNKAKGMTSSGVG